MIKHLELYPEIKISGSEYKRLLGYPPEEIFKGEIKEIAEWSADWFSKNCRPWVYIRKAGNYSIIKNKVLIEDKVFNSTRLSERFINAGVDEIYLAALSAGAECEDMIAKLKLEGKSPEYFFLDAYASAAAELLANIAACAIKEMADGRKAVLPHYSPGYTGWQMEDQVLLWQLLNREGNISNKISMLKSGMLKPLKSMLVVFGVTPCIEKASEYTSQAPCSECLFPGCEFRRSVRN
jgi:hypothetical protein